MEQILFCKEKLPNEAFQGYSNKIQKIVQFQNIFKPKSDFEVGQDLSSYDLHKCHEIRSSWPT